MQFKNNIVSMTTKEISKFLYEVDPIGLVKFGCPENEYDFEARQLTPRIRYCENLEQVHKALYEVFNYSFKPLKISKDGLKEVAISLHAELNKKRNQK